MLYIFFYSKGDYNILILQSQLCAACLLRLSTIVARTKFKYELFFLFSTKKKNSIIVKKKKNLKKSINITNFETVYLTKKKTNFHNNCLLVRGTTTTMTFIYIYMFCP